MDYKNGAQCLVVRNNKILMVKHKRVGREYYTLPGGGIEEGETPEQAAVRELFEECNVTGKIINKLSEYPFSLDNNITIYTFHVDIENQFPMLGPNLSEEEKQVLLEIRWMSLDEICERDRAFLWAAGLMGVSYFFDELSSWSDDISYPNK